MCRTASWWPRVPEQPESYRINDEPDQVRREQDRLRMLSRVADPRLAGVLATFPAVSLVLAAMAHRRDGAGAAIELVHGILAGLLPTVLFFLVMTAF